ncbi:hypothetical protein KC19_VG272200 [Ceratodon purpureus]|uniref:Uncharacterized protein n=1 Tax=Ceratodon purpureus TaxID=3225 RepID=A0A8T0HUU2_CERPU|nr:hypothetical protein KC19_VG272200 [Ceratodon purpureus]
MYFTPRHSPCCGRTLFSSNPLRSFSISSGLTLSQMQPHALPLLLPFLTGSVESQASHQLLIHSCENQTYHWAWISFAGWTGVT